MILKRWRDRPTADILACVRVLLFYLGVPVPPPDRHGPVRPLTSMAMNQAKVLLNVRGRAGAWTLNPKWRERLELAGVDPDGLRVIDERRWAWAWV
ncbi:MAG: hypothetical protein JO015_12650 [Verrucomicrobia bacterium]|nr:hypothetical protein [Verrucomicrobiota bacterium]